MPSTNIYLPGVVIAGTACVVVTTVGTVVFAVETKGLTVVAGGSTVAAMIMRKSILSIRSFQKKMPQQTSNSC